MDGSTPSGERRRLSTRELVLFSLLGAMTFAAKMAMAQFPNIEPVSLMVMLLAVCFGWRGLYAVYLYVFLEFAFWGLGLWNVNYLYVWLVLFAGARLLRRAESPPGLGGAVGLLRPAVRGAVRAGVLGHGRLGLRAELVGLRDPDGHFPRRRELRDGIGALPPSAEAADEAAEGLPQGLSRRGRRGRAFGGARPFHLPGVLKNILAAMGG